MLYCHLQKTIDYLKIDIEASEFPAIRDILNSGVYKQVKQVAIEVHTPRIKRRKREMDILDYAEIYQLFKDWEVAGFKQWDTQYNNCCFYFSALVSEKIAGKKLCCYENYYINKDFL